MANAKKCDRCGGFYVDNKAEHNGHVTGGVAFIGANSWTRDHWGYRDLCDECQGKLDEFLEGSKAIKAYIKSCDNCKFSDCEDDQHPCCDCDSWCKEWKRKEEASNE